MDKGILDLALHLKDGKPQPEKTLPWKQPEHFVALVPTGTLLSQRQAISPIDLLDWPLILPAGPHEQHDILAWFSRRASSIDIAGTFTHTVNAASMVGHGLGIAITTQHDYRFPCVVSLPLEPKLAMDTVLAWKKDGALSPAAKTFLEFLKKRIRNESNDASFPLPMD